MSKIIWGEDINGQIAVLDLVITTDNTAGAASVIKPFLVTRKFVLANMRLKATEALVHEANRIKFEGEAGKQVTERDNLFNPTFAIVMKWVQFLKKLYKGNIRDLQEWGVTVGANGKIYYPAEFLKLVIIAEAMIARHNSYNTPANPGPSPLVVFIQENKNDLVQMTADINAAKVANQQYHIKNNAAIDETAKRNAAWLPSFSQLKEIGEYIVSLYPNEPYKPREWGFEMSDAPAGTTSRKSKIGRGETKKSTNIVIGGIFENTGDTVLLVQKDTKKKDAGKLLQPKDKLLMGKGYSKIMVTNQDTLNEGEYTVDTHD